VSADTEAIGFSYGVTWNLIRRDIVNWKHEQKGNLEALGITNVEHAHNIAALNALLKWWGNGSTSEV